MVKAPPTDQVIQRIVDKLEQAQCGWDKVLWHYWHSQEFKAVIDELKAMVEDNKRFVPKVIDMLDHLCITPYDSIKAVMLIDDIGNSIKKTGIPYQQFNKQMKSPEFLRKDQKGMDIRICTRTDIEQMVRPLLNEQGYFDYDISRWGKQGVLLLPYAPTTRLEKRSHKALWKDYRARIIDIINVKYKNIPWLLVERDTWQYEDLIESKNTYLYTSFPYNSLPQWPDKINEVIKYNKQEPIQWV